MDPAVPSTLPWGSPSHPFPEGSIPALLPCTAWEQTQAASEGDQGAQMRRPTPESILILVFPPIFFLQGHYRALCLPRSSTCASAHRANAFPVVATSQATCSGAFPASRVVSEPALALQHTPLLFSHPRLTAFCLLLAAAPFRRGLCPAGVQGWGSSELGARTALSWPRARTCARSHCLF